MLFSDIQAWLGSSEPYPLLHLPCYFYITCKHAFHASPTHRSKCWPKGTPVYTAEEFLHVDLHLSTTSLSLRFSVRCCLITALSLGLLFLHIFKRCRKRLCPRSCEHQVHALHTWCWAEKRFVAQLAGLVFGGLWWLLPGSSVLSAHQSIISGSCPFHINVDFYLLIYYHFLCI